MKKNWRNNMVLCGLLLLLLFSCNKDAHHSEHADVYTCPMHPTVVSDKPGSCPVCGMDLVRQARTGEDIKISEDLARLMKSPNVAVIASIKTIRPQFKSVPTSVDAIGVVTYDPRRIYTVPARVGGRIENMYLKYEFQLVKKGQKIAAIYSPEFIAAQRELLYLLDNDSQHISLIDGAKRRLTLLGLSSGQLDDLIMQKKQTDVVNIHSPYSGYVITSSTTPSSTSKMNAVPNANNGTNGMTSPSNGSTSASEPRPPSDMLVREGDYVTAGQTLVKIVDPTALRIELDVRDVHAGMVRTGQQIQVDYGNGSEASGRVDFIQPFLDEGENFLRLRVYVQQADKLHIGQLVKAKIELKSTESLWLPRAAVLDLGTGKVVFFKDGAVFKPKKVTTGVRSGDLIEIKSGLASADEIASNAQYLIDNESFIKPVQ